MNGVLTQALNEASENVDFIVSLERFYNPLYRDVEEIHKHLTTLLDALRNVYNASKFYNNSKCVEGFLVKCTNHIRTVCEQYLTNNNTISIFNQPIKILNDKIKVN